MDTSSPWTVLIVDDDQALLRLLDNTLQREGFATATATATASSGKDTVLWLTNHAADLMLLNLKLEDIDGKELLGRLAGMGRSVPFIIMTGQGNCAAVGRQLRRIELKTEVNGLCVRLGQSTRYRLELGQEQT